MQHQWKEGWEWSPAITFRNLPRSLESFRQMIQVRGRRSPTSPESLRRLWIGCAQIRSGKNGRGGGGGGAGIRSGWVHGCKAMLNNREQSSICCSPKLSWSRFSSSCFPPLPCPALPSPALPSIPSSLHRLMLSFSHRYTLDAIRLLFIRCRDFASSFQHLAPASAPASAWLSACYVDCPPWLW